MVVAIGKFAVCSLRNVTSFASFQLPATFPVVLPVSAYEITLAFVVLKSITRL